MKHLSIEFAILIQVQIQSVILNQISSIQFHSNCIWLNSIILEHLITTCRSTAPYIMSGEHMTDQILTILFYLQQLPLSNK